MYCELFKKGTPDSSRWLIKVSKRGLKVYRGCEGCRTVDRN